MILSLALIKRAAQLCPPRIRRNLRDGEERARRLAHLTAPAPVALRLGLFPNLRVLCHPAAPSHHQALYNICAFNGYRIVTDPSDPHDFAIHFAPKGGACHLPENVPVLNRACTDVSKRHVAEVFEQVFGYALSIDPLTYDGSIVEKSDENYTHDGRILQGPLQPADIRPGFAYQRLVDNSDGDEGVDLRTPLYGGRIPVAYIKRRPLATRFGRKNNSTELVNAEDVYSHDEQEKLARFAAAIGLDYGETDVLRDSKNGRIYVVDVNNTPGSSRGSLTDQQMRVALRRLAPAFAALVATVRTRGEAEARVA